MTGLRSKQLSLRKISVNGGTLLNVKEVTCCTMNDRCNKVNNPGTARLLIKVLKVSWGKDTIMFVFQKILLLVHPWCC